MADVSAGWYADPTGAPGQRYWDGSDWTQSSTATGTQAAPQPSGQPHPPDERKLSQAERTQILDVALTSRAPRTVGIIGGRIISGPRITRSATSATVMWAPPHTYPGRILADVFCSFLTCGIYLPFWFMGTLYRPKVDTVTVDEYGNQQWRRATISSAQRVLSVVVGVLALLWIFSVIYVYGVAQTRLHQQGCEANAQWSMVQKEPGCYP